MLKMELCRCLSSVLNAGRFGGFELISAIWIVWAGPHKSIRIGFISETTVFEMSISFSPSTPLNEPIIQYRPSVSFGTSSFVFSPPAGNNSIIPLDELRGKLGSVTPVTGSPKSKTLN